MKLNPILKLAGITTFLLVSPLFLPAQENIQKNAAVVECTMLDLSMNYTESNTPDPGVFSHFSKQERRQLLDTILSRLTRRFLLTSISILPKDSIAYTNSTFGGLERWTKKDKRSIDGETFDFYIKIYTGYDLAKASLFGLVLSNTAQARFSMAIAVFDGTGNRTWFGTAHEKDGIAMGGKGGVNTYYESKNEKTAAYLALFNSALEKIFQ